MPGGDRTGPWGQGPRTGRALGFCAGYDRPGYMSPGWGRGFGGGRGWGRGFGAGRGGRPWGGGRGRVWGGGRAEYFKSAVKEITKRIDELSKEEKSKP
ncbi:hypothetical protein AMJ86_08525 [bacterium SM23_57]|nr:MAG: hypothetical protein AMJ86_08525 [bacterium SM23_57]